MKKVFDMHCHYHLFDLTIKERAEIFKEEFEITQTSKACFLSIPQSFSNKGEKWFDALQNVKGMFLKKYFSPNGYAYAGLVALDDYSDTEKAADEFLKQVTEYYAAGFDGIKMLEGYPSFIKYTGQNIDSPVYDKFYAFCEEKGFPITIHIANPDENWDINKASKDAIAQGRVYDESFPTKAEITDALFNVLDRFPKLRLAVAHFGFFSEHYADAEKYMEYENTLIDITPGGEQLINMSREWEKWLPFWEKYQDRIIYGTDYFAFPKNDEWEKLFNCRPKFLRGFLETNTEHYYYDTKFKGVKLDEKILDKIYMTNAIKLLGDPRPIAKDYFIKEAERLKQYSLSDFELSDLKYINLYKTEND